MKKWRNEEWRIRGGPHSVTFWDFDTPKVFIFDRFYKVFRHVGNAMRKPSLGNAFLMILEPLFRKWPGNDQFEQGFIRVLATRFCVLKSSVFHWFHKVFRRFQNALRKPPLGNAFLMIFEPISDFWLQKSQISTGFIRVVATRFCILGICEFRWRYWVSGRFENALRKHYNRNAFLIILGSFFGKGGQKWSF